MSADFQWRKSSYSGLAECVELCVKGDGVHVRNSQNPDAGTLYLPHEVMAHWIAGIKAGEFDDLAG